MSQDKDKDLVIGVGLDTSQLPQQAAAAEGQIKEAVQKTTDALEAQGASAQRVGKAHQQSASQSAEAWDAAGKGGQKAGQDIAKGAAAGTQAVGGLTTALNVANAAMGVITRAFAIIGLFNQVVSSIKMVMDWWQKMGEKATEVGAKFAATWRAQKQEAEALQARNAPLEALNELIAANDKLLHQKKELAAFDASMRAMEAQRQGHEREAAQARLDAALARGDITEEQHLEGSRALEDAARTRAQQQARADKQAALDAATMDYQQADSEHARAAQELARFQRAGAKVGGGAEYFGMGDLLRAAKTWATMSAALDKAGLGTSAEEMKLMEQRQQNAANFVTMAANTLHVNPKDTQGQDIPITELAQAVQKAWEDGLAQREEAVASTGEVVAPTRARADQARQLLQALIDVQNAENQKVTDRRAAADIKTQNAAAEKARQAREAAEKAAAQAEQAARRAALEGQVEASRTRARTLKEGYDQSKTLQAERSDPSQQTAQKALESLLKRAEQDERALQQLRDAVSGRPLRMTRDEAKRYGADFQDLKSGGWSRTQVAELRQLVQLLGELKRAARQQGQAEQALKTYNRGLKTPEDAGSPAGASLKGLHQGEAEVANAANHLSAVTDAASANMQAIAGHILRMGTATEQQAEHARRALEQVAACTARLERLEHQTRRNIA